MVSSNLQSACTIIKLDLKFSYQLITPHLNGKHLFHVLSRLIYVDCRLLYDLVLSGTNQKSSVFVPSRSSWI